MSNKKTILSLFTTFFKIGAFTFGGGYAMIPLIQEETSNRKHWITEKDLLDVIAISESTPGPISINAATFIGRTVAGLPGAFAATCGVVLPSLILIYLISFVLEYYQSLTPVKYAFFGIRAGVLALVIKGLVSMYRSCPKGAMEYALMLFAFAAAGIFKLNIIIVLLVCAGVGLLFCLRKGGQK